MNLITTKLLNEIEILTGLTPFWLTIIIGLMGALMFHLMSRSLKNKDSKLSAISNISNAQINSYKVGGYFVLSCLIFTSFNGLLYLTDSASRAGNTVGLLSASTFPAFIFITLLMYIKYNSLIKSINKQS